MLEAVAGFIGHEFEDGTWRQAFDSGEKWLGRIAGQPPVTVVIPVYNGRGAVENLLESIENIEAIDTVIIVDDHSPDTRVSRVCADWTQADEKRIYIRNPRNAGFVRSVNNGIRAAGEENDIIILNSDTIPSASSITRLKNASCCLPDVATVTPLSNAAGIFSVPCPKTSNSLLPGWSTDCYASLLRWVSGAPYEVVPAGSGFCLYITRKAIRVVGLFDELLFERGYAEDTDFCRRAARQGFVNVVDMTAFVFHEREASFGSEKSRLKQKNAKLLKLIDPNLVSDTRQWERSTRLQRLWDHLPRIAENISNADKELLLEISGAEIIIKTKTGVQGSVRGYFENGTACIAVTASEDVFLIDFFGIRQVKLKAQDCALSDIAAYLQNKWQGSWIDADKGPNKTERLQ